MAENIETYGGIPNQNDANARIANVNAIHEASVAANDNTVYLPEGDWYIGSDEITIGEYLIPGRSDVDRGAAGLGFTGDGPEKSFLLVGQAKDDRGNLIRYHPDATHPNVTWDNITYDGRVSEWGSLGTTGSQWGMNIEANGDYHFENVRFRNFFANCFNMSGGVEAEINFRRCSFRNTGIEILNHRETSVGHFLSDGTAATGPPTTVSHCDFSLTSGNIIDVGNDTEARMLNIRGDGIGDGFNKTHETESGYAWNVYVQNNTQELEDAQTNPDAIGFFGRNFIKRFNGDGAIVATWYVQDAHVRDTSTAVHRVQDDVQDGDIMDMNLIGGDKGPIRFENVGTVPTGGPGAGDDAFEDADASAMHFDYGKVSVHNVDGTVFNLNNSDGTIDTLHWDNADEGYGASNNVTVNNEVQGGAAFSPVVPSADEVGINSAEQQYETDFVGI